MHIVDEAGDPVGATLVVARPYAIAIQHASFLREFRLRDGCFTQRSE